MSTQRFFDSFYPNQFAFNDESPAASNSTTLTTQQKNQTQLQQTLSTPPKPKPFVHEYNPFNFSPFGPFVSLPNTTHNETTKRLSSLMTSPFSHPFSPFNIFFQNLTHTLAVETSYLLSDNTIKLLHETAADTATKGAGFFIGGPVLNACLAARTQAYADKPVVLTKGSFFNGALNGAFRRTTVYSANELAAKLAKKYGIDPTFTSIFISCLETAVFAQREIYLECAKSTGGVFPKLTPTQLSTLYGAYAFRNLGPLMVANSIANSDQQTDLESFIQRALGFTGGLIGDKLAIGSAQNPQAPILKNLFRGNLKTNLVGAAARLANLELSALILESVKILKEHIYTPEMIRHEGPQRRANLIIEEAEKALKQKETTASSPTQETPDSFRKAVNKKDWTVFHMGNNR